MNHCENRNHSSVLFAHQTSITAKIKILTVSYPFISGGQHQVSQILINIEVMCVVGIEESLGIV